MWFRFSRFSRRFTRARKHDEDSSGEELIVPNEAIEQIITIDTRRQFRTQNRSAQGERTRRKKTFNQVKIRALECCEDYAMVNKRLFLSSLALLFFMTWINLNSMWFPHGSCPFRQIRSITELMRSYWMQSWTDLDKTKDSSERVRKINLTYSKTLFIMANGRDRDQRSKRVLMKLHSNIHVLSRGFTGWSKKKVANGSLDSKKAKTTKCLLKDDPCFERINLSVPELLAERKNILDLLGSRPSPPTSGYNDRFGPCKGEREF